MEGNRTFVKALEAATLSPGETAVIEVEDVELAIFNVNGEFHCLTNECPHRDGPLGEGALEGEVITCPWHGWKINVRTGQALANAEVYAETHVCIVEEGVLLVERPC